MASVRWQTDRGMVLAIGDPLFGSGRTARQDGALPGIDRQWAFLQQNPAQSAWIDGFPDSVGAVLSSTRVSVRRH